jgi:hypothetical protein
MNLKNLKDADKKLLDKNSVNLSNDKICHCDTVYRFLSWRCSLHGSLSKLIILQLWTHLLCDQKWFWLEKSQVLSSQPHIIKNLNSQKVCLLTWNLEFLLYIDTKLHVIAIEANGLPSEVYLSRKYSDIKFSRIYVFDIFLLHQFWKD